MTSYEPDLFATETKKLHRSDAPRTSVAAAESVDELTNKRLVYKCVKDAGERGVTVKEILAQHPDKHYSSLSARPAALEEEGYIFYRKDDERDGSRVMRLIQYRRPDEIPESEINPASLGVSDQKKLINRLCEVLIDCDRRFEFSNGDATRAAKSAAKQLQALTIKISAGSAGVSDIRRIMAKLLRDLE